VLSPRTEEYVLVAHDRRAIEVWTRGEGDIWTQSIHGPGTRAPLDSIGVHIDVDMAYDDAREHRWISSSRLQPLEVERLR
jgi:hypothetical protein